MDVGPKIITNFYSVQIVRNVMDFHNLRGFDQGLKEPPVTEFGLLGLRNKKKITELSKKLLS